MQLHIFNVGHGFCAYFIADNGNVALFDCGRDDIVGFRPSTFLSRRRVNGIELFVISHYDEDHLSDLPNLRALSSSIPIHTLRRNKSITPVQIRELKLRQGYPLGPGLKAALDMGDTYTTTVPDIDFAGAEIKTFQNNYGATYPQFGDTNNLSLVTFIHLGSVSIVLPGDLEKVGWQALLADPNFIAHLRPVYIFVASHHGRANGYLPQVFDFCKPDIIVISDTAIQHDTQDNTYRQHARGLAWNNRTETRYVLTTRKDGNITITTQSKTGYHIRAQQALPS